MDGWIRMTRNYSKESTFWRLVVGSFCAFDAVLIGKVVLGEQQEPFGLNDASAQMMMMPLRHILECL